MENGNQNVKYFGKKNFEEILFAEHSAWHLCFIRFFIAIGTLIHLVSSYDYNVRLMARSSYYPIPIIEAMGFFTPLSKSMMDLLFGLAVLALISLAAGWKVRISSAVVFVCLFLYWGTELGTARNPPSPYVHHSKNLLVLLFFLFSWIPVGQRSIFSGFDTKKVCGLGKRLIEVTLATTYFGAAYCKLVTSGPLWADGYTLQGYLLGKYALKGMEPAYWLANQYWLTVTLSAAVLFLEFTFLFALFQRHLRILYFFSLMSFHVGTYYFMKIDFLQTHCLAFFVFVPEIIERFVKDKKNIELTR